MLEKGYPSEKGRALIPLSVQEVASRHSLGSGAKREVALSLCFELCHSSMVSI